MTELVAVSLTAGISQPVQVPAGYSFHITCASLNPQSPLVPNGTRVVLTFQHSRQTEKFPIAVFTAGHIETTRLDLYIDSPSGRFAASHAVELMGQLTATYRRGHRHLQQDRGLPSAKDPTQTPVKDPTQIVPHDPRTLTADQALRVYQRDQILWLRPHATASFDLAQLCALYAKYPRFFGESWTVENEMNHEESDLNPEAVLGASMPRSPFYVSSILQEDQEALEAFAKEVPFMEPPLMNHHLGVQHDDSVWLFLGSNSKGWQHPHQDEPITGRPEHKDDVEHSGTWHMQLMGQKTWYVRPTPEHTEWGQVAPTLGAAAMRGNDGKRRLCIVVEEGDLLMVNTRLWWHHTVIGPQPGHGVSLSYARDFYLPGVEPVGDGAPKGNVDGVHAPRSAQPGEVVLRAEELPECPIAASEAPNCELSCINECTNEQVLIALKHIQTGEVLTVCVDDLEEYDEYEYDPLTGTMSKVGGT